MAVLWRGKSLHPYCYSMKEKLRVLWHVINKLTFVDIHLLQANALNG